MVDLERVLAEARPVLAPDTRVHETGIPWKDPIVQNFLLPTRSTVWYYEIITNPLLSCLP